MLKVDHLSTSYKTLDGDVHVINDLNFEIRENEIFGIAGESGCGKTTLLKTLYDIVEYPLVIDQGKVTLSGEKNGKPFSFESGQIRKTWWNNISYVPQAAQSVLNPIVRLKKQFLDSIPKQDKRNETEKQTLARVAKYLEELSLSPDVLEAYPFQLSGGMRQRVMIAMALACKPKLLIADEPTTALDVTIQAQILKLMNDLKREHGTSILFITHDLGVIAQMADDVAVMYCGQVVEMAPAKTLFTDCEFSHPYTEGLMVSIPRLDTPAGVRLESIPGSVPHPLNLPKGCKFAPRCKYCQQRCLEEEPELVNVTEEQQVRCFYPRKEERRANLK